MCLGYQNSYLLFRLLFFLREIVRDIRRLRARSTTTLLCCAFFVDDKSDDGGDTSDDFDDDDVSFVVFEVVALFSPQQHKHH